MSNENNINPPEPELEAAANPMWNQYLVQALPGNAAGLKPGSLHHVAGIHFMAEMCELIDPQTQQPPVYFAKFSDVRIVRRAPTTMFIMRQ